MPRNRIGDRGFGKLAASDDPGPKDRKLRRQQTTPAGAVPQRFFAVAEVARLLAVCDKTVRRWIDDGLLPVHQPRGRGGGTRIAECDLIVLLEQSRRD
jgi:excisionase family DNA binding protein